MPCSQPGALLRALFGHVALLPLILLLTSCTAAPWAPAHGNDRSDASAPAAPVVAATAPAAPGALLADPAAEAALTAPPLINRIPGTGPITQRKDVARIATVQIWNDAQPPRDSADIMAPYIERAGHEGLDLIVFPEYHLGFTRIDSPLLAKVGRMAAAARVYVVVGGWEVWGEGVDKHQFANTAFLFDRAGELVGTYRKVHPAIGAQSPFCWPPSGDELEWRMVKGSAFPVFDTDFGRIGLMTCYDGYFFETFEALSLQGAELLVWINGRGMIEDYVVRTASHLTFTAIVTSNHSRGTGAMICDFAGNIKAASNEARDSYTMAEVKLGDLRVHRVNSRMLHQRRPDLYGAITQHHPVWDHYPDIQPYPPPAAR